MLLRKIRRTLLDFLVPKFFWPKTVLIDGLEIYLRDAPYSFGIKWVLFKNPDQYEMTERLFLSKIDSSDNVLEFGGSIGILTGLIAQKINDGKIVSIEADQELIHYSRSWLSRFENLTLRSCFAFPIFDRINLSATFDSSYGSLGGRVTVGTTISSYQPNHYFISDAEHLDNFNPNVLVIDIEGAELVVLDFKPKIPLYVEKIIIELHSFIYGEDKKNEILEVLYNEGFIVADSHEETYFLTRI